MKKNMKTKKQKVSRHSFRNIVKNNSKNSNKKRVYVGGNAGGNAISNKKEKNEKEKNETLIIYYSNNIISNDKDLTGQDALFNNEPNVIITNAKPNKIYMVTMTDPDAPNGEGNSNNFVYTHWVYVTVQKQKEQKGQKDKIIFMPYAPPTPPSGTHRYQFNLYDITNKTVIKDSVKETTKLTARDLMVLRLNKNETTNPDRKKYSNNLASFLQMFNSKFIIQYKVSANKTMSQISSSLKKSSSSSPPPPPPPPMKNSHQQQQIQQQQEQINQLQVQQSQQKQDNKGIGFGTILAANLTGNMLGNILF
jgi:phosphatidylethanolamine-binding protein (PEBP) family uncharacterized protein